MAEDEEDDVSIPGVRPFWSGTISFGLVSVPVSLFPANRPRSGAALRMVAPDGTPLERRYVCSKDEQELGWDEIVRGYEIEKQKFVVVTDEELEAVEPRKSREIDLRLFVERDEIDPKFFDRSYFLTPTAGSTKAYRLLVEVMEKTGRAGIATFVMRSKEYLVAILADKGILSAETMRFADEIRSVEDVGLPKKKKATAADTKRFEREIEDLTKKLDLREFLDVDQQRVEKLAEKKRKKHEDVVKPEVEVEEEEGAEVVDLMAALRQSLQTGKAGRRPAKRAPRRAAAKKAKR